MVLQFELYSHRQYRMENVEMIQMLYEAEATVYLDTATIGNGAGRVSVSEISVFKLMEQAQYR